MPVQANGKTGAYDQFELVFIPNMMQKYGYLSNLALSYTAPGVR